MKRSTQQGFTLIELVMVIVILGILAAVALPKFSNLSENARLASLQGALAAVRTASGIVHSQALVENKSAATGDTVSVEGATINLVYGYIEGTDTEIKEAAGLSSDFTVSATGGVVTVTVPNAEDATKCKFTYTQATSTAAPATITDITDGSKC